MDLLVEWRLWVIRIKHKTYVVETENGRWYKINEYDGYESIEYRDIDDEWELAEDNEI